jgi:hypothetical protein
MLETLLAYAICGVPAYLIARPKAWSRSALAYIIGVAIALATLVAVGWTFDVSNKWFESHIGHVLLVPAVGVVAAWSYKPVVQRPLDQLAECSMLVRLGMALGWLFNVVGVGCVVMAGVVAFSQPGAISNDQVLTGTALLLIAAGVWLLGRGIRFVLVGPKPIPVQLPTAP